MVYMYMVRCTFIVVHMVFIYNHDVYIYYGWISSTMYTRGNFEGGPSDGFSSYRMVLEGPLLKLAIAMNHFILFQQLLERIQQTETKVSYM